MIAPAKIVRTLFVLALMAVPTGAAAQMVCGDRKEIVNALETDHLERKTAEALSGNGGLVEVYVAITGTWTIVMTLPGGPTCLLGAGEDWESWEPVFEPDSWSS